MDAETRAILLVHSERLCRAEAMIQEITRTAAREIATLQLRVDQIEKRLDNSTYLGSHCK